MKNTQVRISSGIVYKSDKESKRFHRWRENNKYYGKQFSILGDSISTLEGYNPPGYNVFYKGDKCEQAKIFEMSDTWWGKVIDYFGGVLLVNNSWSGSRVAQIPKSTKLFRQGVVKKEQQVCMLIVNWGLIGILIRMLLLFIWE